MNKTEVQKFVHKWIDSHEPDTLIKSDIESEGYWYTSKNGAVSINLSVYFESLLEDWIEEYAEMREKKAFEAGREDHDENFSEHSIVLKYKSYEQWKQSKNK